MNEVLWKYAEKPRAVNAFCDREKVSKTAHQYLSSFDATLLFCLQIVLRAPVRVLAQQSLLFIP